MINVDELGARFILGINIGGIQIDITESIIWEVIVAAILAILGIWLGSGLKKVPKGKQVVAEFLVSWVYRFTDNNLGKDHSNYAPLVGTLLMFIFCTSSLGVFGLRPVTADINVTASLAAITFLLIQVDSIRANGIVGRLKEFVTPYPFMLPIKLVEVVTLPLTLALRLFGNIFGGMIVIELWMVFMEFLSFKFSSIPFLRAVLVLPLNGFFDIFEPAIQTYIFVMLTVVNLRLAIDTEHSAKKKQIDANRKFGNPEQAAA
ncbi:MAG: F0F1 ATP synthase subunit A [Firmicutes bacterium]|nr:F0F1 ATP synthase subunit A [Bacillota bacterium]